MNHPEDTRIAAFRSAVADAVRASPVPAYEVVPIVAQMLAVARLYPARRRHGPMGFFEQDGELTPREWRDVLAAAENEAKRRGQALPTLRWRMPRESGLLQLDAPDGHPEGLGLVVAAKSSVPSLAPGTLERLRRALLSELPEWNGTLLGPKPPAWLLHSILDLAFALGERSGHSMPQPEVQDFMGRLVAPDARRRVYCAFEGTAGLALRLAEAGAECVHLDVPSQPLAQLVYALALASDLPLAVQIVHPILDQLDEQDQSFDAAVAVPPIGLMYNRQQLAGRQSLGHSADALHLSLLLKRARGPIACLMGDGFLFRSAQAERFFKEQLVADGDISAVISLPRGTFSRLAVNTSVVFRAPRGSHPPGEVLLVDARRDGDVRRRFAEQPPAELAELVRTRRTTERACIVRLPELLENDLNLMVERHVPAPGALDVRAALGRAQTVPLGDLAEVFRPQALPPGKGTGVTFREVATSDINQGTGTIQLPVKQVTLDREVAAKARRAVLEPGDLVLSIKGRVGAVGIVDEAPTASDPWIPGQSFAVVRMRRSTALADPRVLYRYLSSPLGQKALRALAGGATVPFVQIADVRRLEVPLPSAEDLEHIAEGTREIEELNDQVITLHERMMEIEASLWPMNLVAAADAASGQ